MKTSLMTLLCAGYASADQLYFAPGNQFYDYGVETASQASVFDQIHHPEKLHPTFAEDYKPLTSVLKNQEGIKTNDKLLDDLLITPRKGSHGLMYDEVMGLMNTIAREFPEIVTMESIGRTYQDRDIWMMKVNGAPHITGDMTEKKAILLTAAHHSRELVSTQMPLYTILDLLHGYVNGNQEKINLLSRNQYFVIPMLNTDGCWTIMDHYNQTGELLLKRKNGDYRFESESDNCPKYLKGVDINRNYGYIWGNDNGPCQESFPGPHPFSEPESRAMRNLLMKHQDEIKFVYNFHSYGPMWVWPYNGEIKNELAESNPLAQKVFNEIWDEAKFPSSTLHGNAQQTVGYLANGEANDYIMKAFNIPSVSPELGNDNYFSGEFFIQYDFVVREVLRDNEPWIMHTFKKLGGEADISNVNLNGNKLSFDMVNTGLQDWNMASEGLSIEVSSPTNQDIATTINLPNFSVRQGKRLEITLENVPQSGFEVDFKYKKFGSDTEATVERVQVGQVAPVQAPQSLPILLVI